MAPATVAFVPAELDATGEHRDLLGATPTVEDLLAATRAGEGRSRPGEARAASPGTAAPALTGDAPSSSAPPPDAALPEDGAADHGPGDAGGRGLTLLATTGSVARPPLLGDRAGAPTGAVAVSATGVAPATAPAGAADVAVEGVPDTAGAGVPAPAGPRRHRAAWSAVGVVGVVVVAAVVAAGVQLERPLPAPAWHGGLHLEATAPGTAPVLPWPAKGEAAIAVPAIGLSEQSGAEPPVPIASLTKIMTAYLTLRDHPLAPGAQGPSVVMTSVDQDEAYDDDADGATNVPVVPGERLTERQLLDGLMVHSANNLADTLARWDAGSVAAFVAEMNRTAASLGMTATHYADADGLDPGTVGTPADQLRLVEKAMADPTFAAVVAQPAVTLPLAGTLQNYVPVGTEGIVGVKSGFTQAAMGCLVMAAQRSVGGRDVLVLAAVTGQPGADPLNSADQADLALVNAVAGGIVEVPVVGAGAQVATVSTTWAAAPVGVVAGAGASVLAWPDTRLSALVVPGPLRAPLDKGARVGSVEVHSGTGRVELPARLSARLAPPSLRWRLLRG